MEESDVDFAAEAEARQRAQIEKEMQEKIEKARAAAEVWRYNVHYTDPQNGGLRKYKLSFHMSDGSLEVMDPARDAVLFQRRTYPDITAQSLELGATLIVYKRKLLIHSYGDAFTAQRMEKSVDTDIERYKVPLQTLASGSSVFYMWESALPAYPYL